jgi:glucuronoarabinoxylan endo-1,4-beta-xylanase
MNEAKSRGCTRFISTVCGGSLRRDKYQAFADYLCAYTRGYKQNHDIDIYAISPTNEPDYSAPYSSCRWTGEELQDFLKDYLKPTMKRNGVTVRVMIAERRMCDEPKRILDRNQRCIGSFTLWAVRACDAYQHARWIRR